MIEIRACLDEDFPDIARLLRQLWPSATMDEDRLRGTFVRGLKSELQHYRCAVEDRRIIAFCSLTMKNSLWQQGYLAHLDELVVDESARSRGIGTKLLLAAIEVARSNHAARLELDSAFHRAEAHKFYEQHGFENRAFLFSTSLSPTPLRTDGAQ